MTIIERKYYTEIQADYGKVLDYVNPPIVEGEEEHLYAFALCLGKNDSVDNYIEIDDPNEIDE